MRTTITRELALAHETMLPISATGATTLTKGLTITHGSLKRGVWKISWPIFLTTLCLSIVDLVHVQMAGLLSSGSQAIIGICDQVLLLCVLVVSSLSNATTVLVSKSIGTSGKLGLPAVAAQNLRVTLASGIILMIAVNLLAPVILPASSGLIANCDATAEDGHRYLQLAVLCLIPFGLVAGINAAFVGMGNSKVQLLTLATMALTDVTCTYLFVAAEWPIKGLGVSGIALASIIGYSLAFVIAAFSLMKSELKPGLTDLLAHQPAIARDLVKLGFPPAMQEIAWTSSTFVLFWIMSISNRPSEGVAAWAIGQRLEAFALLPLSPLALAILVIVGQNVGCGRVQRAWQASWGVVVIGIALMLLIGTVFFCLADQIASLANPTADVKPYVVTYLRLAAIGLPFVALETVLGGSLQGLEDSRILMTVGFLSNWAVSLPLMYLFTVGMGHGPTGVWTATLVSTIISGLLIVNRFRSRPLWSDGPARPVANTANANGTVPTAASEESQRPSKRRTTVNRQCVEIKIRVDEQRDGLGLIALAKRIGETSISCSRVFMNEVQQTIRESAEDSGRPAAVLQRLALQTRSPHTILQPDHTGDGNVNQNIPPLVVQGDVESIKPLKQELSGLQEGIEVLRRTLRERSGEA